MVRNINWAVLHSASGEETLRWHPVSEADDDLKTLDRKLKLPVGWKYRVKVLDRDLGIGAIDSIAHVTQDDLENTYNACFEANNQKNCTFKP